MSSEKTPEKGKNQDITRNKQSRRKMLKSMAVGGGAVVAGKSLPDQWAKPMVDSVLLPTHAQTSPIELTCTLVASMQAESSADGGLGSFAVPGSYTTAATDGANLTVTPQVSVPAGITDGFNLTTVVTGGDISLPPPADLNQNVTPDPTNGAIVFNTIVTSGHDDTTTNYAMTLTPDNTGFCGAAQVIDISFPNG